MNKENIKNILKPIIREVINEAKIPSKYYVTFLKEKKSDLFNYFLIKSI